ncbi:MAG: hypothetical protein AAF560_03900 [Acidobacteriota bacterium]
MDEVPAATLLIPHFMIDLDACDPAGLNTVVKITNASPEATVAQLTFWSDWGAPVIEYQIYLSGYDVETLDLADHFCNGNVAITGPNTSPHGHLSGDPAMLTDCDLFFPFQNPVLVGSILDRFRRGHTGQPLSSIGGNCFGATYGDNVARGYMTIDVVDRCALLFPHQGGYFQSVASFENRLLGEYFYVDPATGFYQSYPAIHIEADGEGLTFGPGDHTFYGRFVSGLATDRREPLPTTFGASFVRSEIVEVGTELLIWRESPGVLDSQGAVCDSSPGEFPLAAPEALAFDEEENPFAVSLAAELQTQRLVLVDSIPPSETAGWLLMDLSHDAQGGVFNDGLTQSWATTLTPRLDAVARDPGDPPAPSPPFAGFPAVHLDNLCAGRVLPP